MPSELTCKKPRSFKWILTHIQSPFKGNEPYEPKSVCKIGEPHTSSQPMVRVSPHIMNWEEPQFSQFVPISCC